METQETVGKRVARGAAWLDSICPDWRGRIGVDYLDLRFPSLCVLGQVFADEASERGWANGYAMVTVPSPDGHEFAVTHGFTSDYEADSTRPLDERLSLEDAAWNELREAWIDELGATA
jgi:hypothetical protein